MSAQFDIHQAKDEFISLIEKVSSGDEIIICKEGNPIARITAIKEKKRRMPGTAKGKLKISDDFDAPLPESILESFETK